MRRPLCASVLLLASLSTSSALAATYEVGPGKPYTSIGAVPWESLAAGDIVLINWRSAPYKEKWAIGGTGTAAQPIVVRGVLGPGGERPVIDGNGATTRTSSTTGTPTPSTTGSSWLLIGLMALLLGRRRRA